MSDRKQEAILAFSQGMDIPDLACELGVSVSTVYRWLKEADLVDRFKAAREAAIVEVYTTTNLPTVEIMQRFEIQSPTTLYRILRKHDVDLRVPKKRRATLSDAEIVQMYQAGDPILSIISKSGRASNYIYKLLHDRGVPLRRPTIKQ